MSAMLARWGGAWVVILLVLGTALEATGLLPSALSRPLMIVLIAAGGVWALRSERRNLRLAELYLWMAFILPYGPLTKLAQIVAWGIESDQVVVYAALSIIHLGVVVAALTVLGAWKSDSAGTALARRAAALLIIAAVIFWSGAATWPGTELQKIGGQMHGHMWTSSTFLLATILTLGGLLLLTLWLRDAGEHVVGAVGLAAYLFGATFWAIHLAFRLTVMPWAAQEFLRDGAAPSWYEPWHMWSGLLFALYSVLAYGAIAAYGVALLRTGLLARWAGWTCIGFAALNAPVFGPPLLIHVMPWMLGILLLQPGVAAVREAEVVEALRP